MTLDRQDVLLLLASGAGGPYDFDPIRAMKSCFIVSEIGKSEWHDLFDFRAYDYGPFDASVYRARDALIARNLLRAEQTGRYAKYTLTPEGRTRVAKLEAALPSREVTWLKEVGRWATSKSFTDLLSEVYQRFPKYAERSVARLAT